MRSDSTTFWDRFAQSLQDRLLRRAVAAAVLAAVVLFGGMIYYWQHNTSAGESLPASYGKRRGRGSDSVNGTSVLADMFELRGFQVRTTDRLSPRLNKDADVIVWFPNDFEPPTKKQRRFLEHWLADTPGRTLVYVGRDYDAAPHYWKEVQKGATPADAKQMAELAAQAEAAHAAERRVMPKSQFAGWFTVNSGGQEQTIKKLSGPWSQGIDSAKTHIPLRGRLDVPVAADATDGEAELSETEPLLIGNRQTLAFRATAFDWPGSDVIVVANGSFLLNYPLVNREHRKLAAALIDECDYGRNVVFLESGPGGPEVLDKDPTNAAGLAMLRIWPLNAIVIHLTVFGIVYCLARWPVFGRPKELPAENPADFGRHVAALGQLLARTKNLTYAQTRLAQYQQQARRGSGATHRQ